VVETSAGNLLDPIHGVNIEAGIKGEWHDGAVNGSLAVYRIHQDNWPVLIGPPRVGDMSCCYYGVANKSRGVDAEINGEVLRGWRLGAGYTFNERESVGESELSGVTPRHLLKAWTSVRLRGDLDRWEVGGSVHAQSATTSRRYNYCSVGPGCLDASSMQSRYAVVDLRAAFDIDRNWQAALTVNNLFDATYYQALDNGVLHAWYGDPRNWMLRVDARF